MKRLVFVGAIAIATSMAQAFTLVENGKAAPVVLPAGAEESSKLAAVEWTNYVFKATGAAPEVLRAARWSAPTKDGAVGGDHRAPRAEGGAVGGDHRAPRVIIGTLATLKDVPQAIREKLAEAKSCEASVTAEVDGNFWIVGKEETGELYGTYRTLEAGLGVRWFNPWTPEDPGDYVPEKKVGGERRWTLDGTFTFRSPHFKQRRLDMTGCTSAHVPEYGVQWAYRTGLQVGAWGGADLLFGPDPRTIKDLKNRSMKTKLWDVFRPRTNRNLFNLGGYHGTFYEPIPASKYAKDHPEYFAEVEGKRLPGVLRYCISNTNVQHLVAQDVIRRLRISGGRGEYIFGLMDGRENMCECKQCQAYDDAGAKRRRLNADITTRFNRSVKNILDEVYAEFPNADGMTVWAYSIYGKTPPTEVKQDPRTGGNFCITERCYGHTLDDPTCPLNAQRYPWLQGWMKSVTHGYTYEYGNCSNPAYSPYELAFASDIKLYAKMGLTGWKEEMYFADALPGHYYSKKIPAETVRRKGEQHLSNWQWYYMASRLTWDPSLDPQAILDEGESKYYGEAYPAMKKYHALRRKLWAASKVCLGYPRGNPRRPTMLETPGSKEELLGYLDEAERIAASPTTKVRVARDRRFLTLYWIEENDRMHAKAGKALTAKMVATPPVLDGADDDACWKEACTARDFRATFSESTRPAPEVASSVSVLADADNLYVFGRFKEPSPGKIKAEAQDRDSAVFSDDALEILLFPPSEANTYFQIGVNAKGKLCVLEQPAGRARPDVRPVAVGKVGKDAWTVELKIPAEKMYPLAKGDSWRVMFLRDRMVKDQYVPTDCLCPHCWSYDGGKPNVPSDFVPMAIGGK